MEATEIVREITRINKKTGRRENIWFHGPKSTKPKGWHFTGKTAHNYPNY